jgi:hypothetical protein
MEMVAMFQSWILAIRYVPIYCSLGVGLSFSAYGATSSQRLETSENPACASIAGEFKFWTTLQEQGKNVSISFLDRLLRPSTRGIHWARIVKGESAGEFDITFLDSKDEVVGSAVRIATHCVNGKWEESKTYKGNSDGTLVQGRRVWKYSIGEHGAIVVEYDATSTSQYFPGINSLPRTVNNVVIFEKRKL